MKKLVHYFIFIILFSILIPIRSVFADESDYLISYDITDFSIKGDDINFSGFSFLNHMDNYGGINMVDWIVAYTGNWNNSWNNRNNCKNSKNCYYKLGVFDIDNKNNSNKTYDLYFIRCTDSACSDSVRKKIVGKLNKGKKSFETNSCYLTDGGYGGSHCTYHNVGFTLTISLSDLISKFGENASVKFKIFTKVKYNGTYNKKKKEWSFKSSKTDSSDIGIISNSCTSIWGKKCNKATSSTKFNTRYSKDNKKYNRSVKLGGLSKEVLFTAKNATGFSKAGYGHSRSGGYFLYNKDNPVRYTLVRTEAPRTYRNWKYDRTGNFRGRLFYIKGHQQEGYAWSGWVKSSGNLQLNLSQQEVPEPCSPNNYCVGGNCTYSTASCGYDYPSPTKLDTPICEEKVYNKCEGFSNDLVSCGTTMSKTFYYKASKEEAKNLSDLKVGSSSSVINWNNDLYFPIKFFGNINYVQNSTLNLDFRNNQSVNSGRYFRYYFDYDAKISWNYLGNYNGVTTKNSTYQSTPLVVRASAGGNSTKNVNIYFSLKDTDKLYERNESGDFSFVGILGSDGTFYKKFVRKSVQSQAEQIDISSTMNDSNYVKFPDSNDINSNDINTTSGDFSCNLVSFNGWDERIENEIKCNYKVNDAYFKNDGSGYVIYDNEDGYSEDVNRGNSYYYVPENLKSNSYFTFYPQFSNLSFLADVKISYKTTCSVVGKNEIHDKIKYRSIDTSNPFPDGSKISKNWEQYIKDYGLNRITLNSFSAISYQTNIFRNRSAINNLKSVYGDYYSYGDMNNNGDGTSSVIHSDQLNLFSRVNGNHCTVGRYNSSCDRVKD